jgi:hypothetical protein
MPDLSAEDYSAIVQLYARQAHLIDGGDGAGWAATFEPDGEFESPTYKLHARGRRELSDFADKTYGDARAHGQQIRHYHGQVVVDGSPAESARASATSYLLIVVTTAAGTRADRSVVVSDELIKRRAGWSVISRRVTRDDAGLSAADIEQAPV